MRLISLARTVAVGAALSLVAGASLLAPTTAQAVQPVSVSVSPIGSLTVPTGSTYLSVTVTFTGPAVSNDVYYTGYDAAYNSASITTLSSLSASPTKPGIYVPSLSSAGPGSVLTYQVSLGQYTSPGKYRLTVPVSAHIWNGSNYVLSTGVGIADFVVNANRTVSQSYSSFAGNGKYSKSSKWRWYYAGPSYVVRASVKVFYRATGAKKFVLVASSRTNASGRTTFYGKKGAIRKKGKVYFLIGGVAYSPSFKSRTMNLVRV